MSRAVAILVTACSVLLIACGGDEPTGGGGAAGAAGAAGAVGGSGGASGDCRFEKPACSTCIGTDCTTEANDCYGTGWIPAKLCSGTSSAMCTASSASEGLKKQTAYANCVAAHCTTACE